MASPPAYISAADPGYVRLADMVLVVEGKELLTHIQVVAKECPVIQDLCTAQTQEQSHEQSRPAKQIKLADGSAAARVSFRLEEPFASFCLPEVELLLTIIYDMGSAAQHIAAAAAAEGGWAVLGQAVKLADFLGAHRVLAAVDTGLCGMLPADATQVSQWEPVLRLADAYQAQLPEAYAQALRLAVMAFCTVQSAANGQVPGLEILTSASFKELSGSSWRAITCGLFGGLRQKWRNPDTPWADVGKRSSLGLQIKPKNACFTWDWMPAHDLQSPQAKNKHYSAVFNVAGCNWRLTAYVNEENGVDFLAVYLEAAAGEAGQTGARYARASFTIKGKEDYSKIGQNEVPFSPSRGYSKFIRVSDLQDESKGYLVDGKIKIEVKFLSLRILDA